MVGTFIFADLAGWTALTEAHGDAEAIDIVTQFARRVRELLPEHRGEEVKTIGDAVMLRFTNPGDAVRLGLRVAERLSRPGSPPVRIGMHTGPAVERDGDWLGATVNLTSRVVTASRPGEVLLTEDTRRALDDQDGFDLEDRGTRYFRHIPKPVRVYRAVGGDGVGGKLEIDPVCRMAVDPAQAAASRRRMGLRYYFCSPECVGRFATAPRRYVATSAAARTAQRGFLINLAAFLVVGAVHLVASIDGASHAGEHLASLLLSIFAVWAIILVFHFRAVRRLL